MRQADGQAGGLESTRSPLFGVPAIDGTTIGLESVGAPAGHQGTPAVLSAGTLVNGRYRVRRLIGAGGMGLVYRVDDELKPDRPVALKMLAARRMTSAALGVLNAEFASMAKLKHPNVARVYDFETLHDSGLHFFTMEFVPGKNLRRATKGLSWRAILGLVAQVCRALSYVHSRHIVHCDLKPSNVLVDAAGTVKVLDFGVSGAIGGLGVRPRGTPTYMAPELVDRGIEVDHRADLYSLGIMLFELLCGRPPFTAPTTLELLRKHHQEPIAFRDDERARLPGWLTAVVGRLTAKQASDRYRTANAVIEAFNSSGEVRFDLETADTRESYVLSSRFVGRAEELGTVHSFVRRRTAGAANGSAPLLLVAGPGGIGKSRLMRELRYRCQLSGLAFVEGDFFEGVLGEYPVIAETLRQVLALADALDAGDLIERFGAELVKLLPSLERRGIERSPALDDPAAEQRRLSASISRFLVELALKVPFVLYLDDLQWAPAGAVDVLGSLVDAVADSQRSGTGVPLALLGCLRDDEIEARPVETLVRRLEARDAVDVVSLSPLAARHLDRLLASMLGVVGLPPAFVERVGRETQGIPFFVEEVMRTLVSNGSVYLERGSWAAAQEIQDLEIPASMVAALLRRVSMLTDTQREVLSLVAAYGQPISPELLLRASRGRDDGSVSRALLGLRQRRMVQPLEGDDVRYQISHDRMRETLYEHFEAGRRAALHLALGEALEAEPAERRDAHLYELAHHFWHSGDQERALRYCLAAGERAKRGYANDLGIEMFQRALQLMADRRAERAGRLAATESLADLLYLKGRYAEALAAIEQVLAAAQSPVEKARLERKSAQVFFQLGDLRKSAEYLWEAVNLLGSSRPPTGLGGRVALVTSLLRHLLQRFLPPTRRKAGSERERRRLRELGATYLRIAYVHFFDRPDEMVLPLLRATTTLERVGESKELCHAYAYLAMVYGSLGLFRGALRYSRQSRDMAERLDSPFHVAVSCLYHSMILFFRGDLSRCLSLSDKAWRLFLECGDHYELGMASAHACAATIYSGKMRRALRYASDGLNTLERTGHRQMIRLLMCIRGWTKTYLGHVDEGLIEGWRAVREAEEAGDLMSLCEARNLLGQALYRVGQVDRGLAFAEEAVAQLEAARELREEHRLSQPYMVEVYPMLARAYLEVLRIRTDWSPAERRRTLRKARRALRQATKLTRRDVNYHSTTATAAAAFAWERGRPAKARRHFQRAMAVAERLGHWTQLADAHFMAGRYLAASGDSELGRDYLERALRFFEEAESGLYIGRTRELLEQASH